MVHKMHLITVNTAPAQEFTKTSILVSGTKLLVFL
jgi:hypothetical protein